METSFESSGTLLGVNCTETGTYWSAVRSDGSLYGEGQGILMGQNGEMATWIGQGVGIVAADGGVSFRGAVYYESPSSSWSRLNRVAAVFEFDVDAAGNAQSQLWEWK